MKTLNKKDYYNILILFGIFSLIVIVITRMKYVYGSVVDWENQHFIFPEYFRLLFYETKEFFPSFCMNLGAGQDIYNFSYYGLYNPIIVISYLFPFISMSRYIIITSIMIIAVSICLFYYWIKSNGYTQGTSFVATLMFMCAAPLIFHSHRHIMFVNYFPFLILSLICVDRYAKTKRISGIVISVFLIILTSYYYAIECIMTICLYAVYKYLTYNKFDIKSFWSFCWKIGVGILIGTLMSSFLIIPTLNIISAGRENVGIVVKLKDVILPRLNFEYVFYSEYAVGITGIGLIGMVISIFKGRQGTKFLSIVLCLPLIFPIIVYILNGGQYMASKVLIPFLPLYVLIIAKVSRNIENHKFSFKLSFWVVGVMTVIVLAFSKDISKYLFLGEMASIAISLAIVYRVNKRRILFITICAFAIVNCFRANISDNLVTIKQYKTDNSKEKLNLINRILDTDKGVYRFAEIGNDTRTINKIYDNDYYQCSVYSSLTNKNYSNFYSKTFRNNITGHNTGAYTAAYNPLFLDYMGVKYLVQSHQQTIEDGNIVFESKNYDVYENSNALPLIYAKNKVMSLADFEALQYPYNIEALLNYIIVDGVESDPFESKLELGTFSFANIEENTSIYSKQNETEIINAGKGIRVKCEVGAATNKYLLLSFDINQDKQERYIEINGVRNNLSAEGWRYHNRNYRFHYVISNPSDGLDITFSKGIFKINDIKAYYIDKTELDYNDLTEVVINSQKTKGDNIYGNINLLEESYIKTSIPYADGFTIYVDGKKVETLCVDTAFVGFRCCAGEHEIIINYKNPVLKKSIVLSALACAGFIVVYSLEEFKRIKKYEELDISVIK